MVVEKIKKIKNYGVYREFSWGNLDSFKRYNAIYGFNGSGKSTLAIILNSLNTGKLAEREKETEIEIQLKTGEVVDLKEEKEVAKVLAYDQNFLIENFKWDEGIKSFVVIGVKSKTQSDKLKELNSIKDNLALEKKIKENEVSSIEELIGNIGTEIAADLKKTLVQYYPSKYGTYNRKNLTSDMAKTKQDLKLTTEFDFLEIQNAVSELQQTTKAKVVYEKNNTAPLLNTIQKAIFYLRKSAPCQVDGFFGIEEIDWLEKGLVIHAEKDNCLFCKGSISSARVSEIKTVVYNEFSKYIKEGKSLLAEVEGLHIKSMQINKNDFYDEVYNKVSTLKERQTIEIEKLKNAKNTICELVKLRVSLEVVDQNFDIVESNFKSIFENLSSIDSEVDELLILNNKKSSEIESIKKINLEKIEYAFFQRYKSRVMAFEESVSSKKNELDEIVKKIDKNKLLIEEISKELESEAQAILGINKMLHAFLGRMDISLQFNEAKSKFEIKRKDKIIKRLSEGEKTAISICYFLMLVNADQDVKKKLVVLLDDPITSLDSNNIYNAYSAIKESLQDVAQLFIFTHNLVFFRLISRMLSSYENSQCFCINTLRTNNNITSTISLLNKKSREASTEYIMLYVHLKKFILSLDENPDSFSDNDYLPYPNMLRRFLEAYIYSKEPGASSSDFETPLRKYGVSVDVAQKANRFANDFSHSRLDSIYGADLSSIASTAEILRLTISELETIDPIHFNSMKSFLS